MKSRKSNLKDKIDLTKVCLVEIMKGLIEFDVNRMIFAWFILMEGLKGNCEIVEE